MYILSEIEVKKKITIHLHLNLNDYMKMRVDSHLLFQEGSEQALHKQLHMTMGSMRYRNFGRNVTVHIRLL